MQLPEKFCVTLQQIQRDVRHVDGWLTDRELSFLALLGACPTTAGAVLEIPAVREALFPGKGPDPEEEPLEKK